MVIGKKDRARMEMLEREYAEREKVFGQEFILYLHDTYEITYNEIADLLGVSQQYINAIAVGTQRPRNITIFDKIYKALKK